MQPGNNMSLRGAVDLAAVKAAADAAAKAEQMRAERARKVAAGEGDAAAEPLIFSVTEADFEAQIVPLSAEVPVLLLFWADGYGPAEQQVPVMEALAEEYDGRFVLAEVNVRDAQRLAQQLQLRDLPTVLVVVAGQLIPLFEGPAMAEEIRPLLDQLIKEAAERFGIAGEPGSRSGKGEPGAAGDTAEPPQDPALTLAHEALDQGDLGGAIQAYRNILTEQPANEEAKLGLAQAELLQRVQGLDPAVVRKDAAEKPGDVAAQIAAADLDLVGGHVDDAFGRLVDTVGRTAGEDRDRVRTHLLGLFEVIGADDARVVKARGALARKLF
ncbi:tetratricopeptide repeat protein [Streptacidiphilus fuscans]|uniref:Tetratricopeptide repeat protein n=1 Tax=Streptacidiphilus fuscans TaxID=2789292 RepID=A0A931B2E4_9ACTN|nr:tetratricopeptide repeat protein [Streptacidiphilus fuscans]MBF9067437.1 tetratricopeptide repeat protein [Streptacidiphilus fuscans]